MTELAKPFGSMAVVRLLDDYYTPMEFVVEVLELFFEQDHETATQIMLKVHNTGVGACGVYPFDIAEEKVREITMFAREHGHPLECFCEPSASS
jgi:ATP-dependent Clp protease adaptor protein ClpS